LTKLLLLGMMIMLSGCIGPAAIVTSTVGVVDSVDKRSKIRQLDARLKKLEQLMKPDIPMYTKEGQYIPSWVGMSSGLPEWQPGGWRYDEYKKVGRN